MVVRFDDFFFNRSTGHLVFETMSSAVDLIKLLNYKSPFFLWAQHSFRREQFHFAVSTFLFAVTVMGHCNYPLKFMHKITYEEREFAGDRILLEVILRRTYRARKPEKSKTEKNGVPQYHVSFLCCETILIEFETRVWNESNRSNVFKNAVSKNWQH